MSKWVMDEWDWPLDYPALGFRAEPGDILDATAAPDSHWSLNGDQGAAETVTRYTIGSDPDYVEPADGHVLTWSDADNAYVPTARTVFTDVLAADLAPVVESGGEPFFVSKNAQLWDVRDHDITLDGTTLVDTELDTLLGLMDPGDVLFIPGAGGMKLANRHDISQKTIIDGNNATIVQGSNNGALRLVAGSDGSRIRNLKGEGPGSATFAAASKMILVEGTPGGDWVEDIKLENVHGSGWGYGTFQAKYARRVTTRDVHTEDNHYAGQEFLSCEHVALYNPTCDGLVGLRSGGAINTCYPVAFTRDSAQPIADAPRTYDAKVFGGWAKNTTWEALDTHAAVGVKVFGYDSWNTYKGISFVGCPDEFGVQKFAPLDNWAFGCTAYSEVSDGSASDGFQLCGQNNWEQATGGFVGCTAVGYGTQDNNAGSGAFRMRHTDRAILRDAASVEGSPAGLALVSKNYGLIIDGFDVIDPWSNAYSGGASAIQLFDVGQILSVSNVRVRAGSKAATYLRAAGIRGLAGDTTSQVYWGPGNDMTTAVTARFVGGMSDTLLRYDGTHVTINQAAYSTAQNLTDALNMISATDNTGASNAAPYGYTTAAQANAIITNLNLARLDIISLKKTLNGVIDILQSKGWA